MEKMELADERGVWTLESQKLLRYLAAPAEGIRLATTRPTKWPSGSKRYHPSSTNNQT
jgi:hypothetical protein